MLLRREKWFEYPLRTLDTPAVVADLGLDHLRYPAHIQPQNPVARNGAHRLNAVANEIDQHLLNLNAIDRDSRKAAFDLDIHADRAPRSLFGHEVAHLGKDAAKRRAASRFQGLPEQGANSAHDVGGTVRITNDALHCSVRSLDIWRLRRKPALAGMRVGNNSGQRLVHLVCDRSRELREARRLARTRKSLLRQTQLFLRPNLAVDVQADHVPLHNGAFGVSHRPGARLYPAIFAIEAPQTVPPCIRLAGGQRMGIFLLDPRQVVGMNTSVECAVQPGISHFIQFFKLVPEEFAELLAAIYRLAIRRGAIDHCRKRFNELAE